jgi:hypothetical protein
MKMDDLLTYLEDRVKILEQENIETTNALYEIENRLQSQIDSLINYTMQQNERIKIYEDTLRNWAEPNDVY